LRCAQLYEITLVRAHKHASEQERKQILSTLCLLAKGDNYFQVQEKSIPPGMEPMEQRRAFPVQQNVIRPQHPPPGEQLS